MVEAQCQRFEVRSTDGERVLFAADEEEISIGTEKLRVTGGAAQCFIKMHEMEQSVPDPSHLPLLNPPEGVSASFAWSLSRWMEQTLDKTVCIKVLCWTWVCCDSITDLLLTVQHTCFRWYSRSQFSPMCPRGAIRCRDVFSLVSALFMSQLTQPCWRRSNRGVTNGIPVYGDCVSWQAQANKLINIYVHSQTVRESNSGCCKRTSGNKGIRRWHKTQPGPECSLKHWLGPGSPPNQASGLAHGDGTYRSTP